MQLRQKVQSRPCEWCYCYPIQQDVCTKISFVWIILFFTHFFTLFSSFDNQIKQVEVDGIEYELTIWDTPGGDEMKRLRCHAYPKVRLKLANAN